MELDGLGITALPQAMVAGDVAEGRLVTLLYDWAPDPLHFFARFDADRTPRVVAEAAVLAAEVAQA